MRPTKLRFDFVQKRYLRQHISKEIKRIENTSGEALRELWRKRFWCRAPGVKTDEIFRLLYAWRIQARAFGGVDRTTLDKIALTRQAITARRSLSPVVTYLKPGMVLVRIWRSKEHRVLVRETGYEYESQVYRTLSHISKIIAGPKYSGPTFFGVGASGRKAAVVKDAP
jgi:hypothetical protein